MDKKEKDEEKVDYGTTEAQIAAWKDLYGDNNVRRALLPLDDNGDKFLGAIVKAPDRKVMSEWEKWSDKNPDKAKEIMVNGCLLTRKDEVKADTALFFAAFDAASQLIPVRKAILKN